MREKIYRIVCTDESKYSRIYDIGMLIVITASLIPLAFKTSRNGFDIIDLICVVIFIIDYILRWMTADYRYNDKSVMAFIKYPFSVMAIIDLLSILPSLNVLNSAFKVLRVTRMFKAFKVFRVFRVFRYSKSIRILVNVAKNSKNSLILVGTFAVLYIVLSALVMFTVETQTFDSYFDALYWATSALTTVGYGDICPVTTIGRAVSMLNSLMGIAIIALPSGIITAGYMTEVNRRVDGEE